MVWIPLYSPPIASSLNHGERLRLVAVGRVGPEKNALNLIRGLVLFHREAGYIPEVSWVGERDGGRAGKGVLSTGRRTPGRFTGNTQTLALARC